MMPKSFLVKKRDELSGQILLDSTNTPTTTEGLIKHDMDTPEKADDKIQDDFALNCEKKNTILKIPNEKDSLHKFTIARMLEVPSTVKRKRDLFHENDEIYLKREKLRETVDENCNTVDCDKPQEGAFDLRMKPPAEAVALTDARHIQGRGDTKANNRSPNGSPSEPPKLYDHFPWQSPIYSGLPPAFSSYFPVGLPFPGHTPSLPFATVPEKHFPIKPYPDPAMAFSSVRTFLPNPRFLSARAMPYYPSSDKVYPTGTKIPESQLHAKLLNSAFDPVMSKFVYPRDSIPMELDLSTSGKKKEKEGEPTRYHCDGCTKVYATFSGLSKHKQFHCSSQVKKEFSCKYCEKTYVSLGALKMHIRTHTLPCKCKLCGKAFSRPWLLQGHIRTHTGEKPFRCDHCARAFADRSNLRAHLQTHSDIKKYSCKSCSKTFSRMSLLLKHEDGCCGGSPLS